MSKYFILKSLIVGIVVAVGCLVAVSILWKKELICFPMVLQQTIPPPLAPVEITEIKGNKLPDNLPKDIVLEKCAKVLYSGYTKPFPYISSTSTIYQVRSFFNLATRKSLDENFASYTQYLNKSGWQTLSSINLPHLKELKVIKTSDKMTIKVSKNTQLNKNIIEILNIHIGAFASLNKVK